MSQSGQALQSGSNIEELLSQSYSLSGEFEQHGEIGYIERALVLDRRALSLCTPGHLLQAECLNSLSGHIWDLYNKLGGIENINEAIGIAREALSLRPHGHPDRSQSLVNLAIYLGTRHETLGEVADLSEAITLDQEALSLRPVGHPRRSISLESLAARLSTRYSIQGAVEDLAEAIDLDREALSLRPPGHPTRSMPLSNLAIDLSIRYNRLGAEEDLIEAIDLDREALSLRPPGHPDRSTSLNNLANHISIRYDRQRAVEDLTEAVDLTQEALLLLPLGHPNRSALLSNLANRLSTRYGRHGVVEDIIKAIDLDRKVISLRPPGHPDRSLSLTNLEVDLSTRYNRLGAVEDLIEAIDLGREVLLLRPPGHPLRSSSLRNLTIRLKIRCKQLGVSEDEEEIFRLFSELACDMPAVSSDDLSAAKAWVRDAEEFCHTTTLLAYQTALRLLVQHVASLPSLPQHLSLLKSLSSSLAVDAFSAHTRSESPIEAIELLEQGRAVFWSQLIRLRSPLENVVACGPTGRELADQFTRLTSDIQRILSSSDENQHDKIWRLNMDLEKTVAIIRQLPGLSRFLLPPLFSDLRLAAIDGPVIIVNASQYSCDALVVSIDSDPAHVPLPVTKMGLEDLSLRLAALTARAKIEDVTRDMMIFLRALWDKVVSQIYHFLERKYDPGSRVWWCPTSEFSQLPLHAANPYRKNQDGFSDVYISSYTPSLSALVRARRCTPSPSGQEKRFLAVGQADAVGTSQLFTVGAELANIGQCLGDLSTFTCIQGEESSISRVTEELGENEWVHLACHGIPNPEEPFDSGFALQDGRLTVRRISQISLQNAEFAFLSACHTLAGDKDSPDEAIHLAGAMQFAGFRSVIGTLWAVDDAQALKVTSAFYKNMLECGGLDHTQAAEALWKTVRTVKGVTLDQRILYVHIGV